MRSALERVPDRDSAAWWYRQARLDLEWGRRELELAEWLAEPFAELSDEDAASFLSRGARIARALAAAAAWFACALEARTFARRAREERRGAAR